METLFLDRVEKPSDIKKMSIQELEGLASDIRFGVINHSNTIGGHFGPDLGIVEATIALHYVFDSPKDKLIFDVSHQCYPHKMLTGRKGAFLDPLHHMEITGYTNQHESEHDFFTIGHTSTSISLACGMAKARDLQKEKYNVIAIIGDGSLSGGEAFEGLNNAAVLNSNFIVIVNDNEMSIAPTNGGLFKGLADLRATNGTSHQNIFKAMGYDYFYVEEGNNIKALISALQKIKDTQRPTVLHIHTLKGKGFKAAEEDKESYHWILAGTASGKIYESGETYDTLMTQFLLNKKEKDKSVIAVSPATPGICGFTPAFRQKMGENYTDVDIAEQHAVGYVSGLAINGAKPVLAVHSSFIQRAYDQLSQDLAINKAPATILICWGAIGPNDITHLTIFDIPLISNIPNIVFLAPTCKEEYLAMLDWSLEQKSHPVVIRAPFGPVISSGETDTTDYGKINQSKVTHTGQKIAIIGAGNFYHLAKTVREEIKNQFGINATLINPVYLSGLDQELLNRLKKDHDIVITLEDGCLAGGFGEKVSAFYGDSDMKVLNYGATKEFTDRISINELYERYHLTPRLICEDLRKLL